jgi:hypothetical protein
VSARQLCPRYQTRKLTKGAAEKGHTSHFALQKSSETFLPQPIVKLVTDLPIGTWYCLIIPVRMTPAGGSDGDQHRKAAIHFRPRCRDGMAACCARAASGHANDAPPSNVMKSRRLIRPAHQQVRAPMKELSAREL